MVYLGYLGYLCNAATVCTFMQEMRRERRVEKSAGADPGAKSVRHGEDCSAARHVCSKRSWPGYSDCDCPEEDEEGAQTFVRHIHAATPPAMTAQL